MVPMTVQAGRLRASISVNLWAARGLTWATQAVSRPCAAPASGTAVTCPPALKVEPPLWAMTRGLSTSASCSQSFATGPGGPTSPTNAFDDKMRDKTEQELLQIIAEARSHVKPGDAAAEEDEVEEDPVNPETGERYGPRGKEPTRYGDWENKGRCTDFS